MAANQAIVDYDTENLEPPILTVEEAVERSSFFEVPPVLQPKQVGDFSKGMAEADHKILSAKVLLICYVFFPLLPIVWEFKALGLNDDPSMTTFVNKIKNQSSLSSPSSFISFYQI